MGFIEKLAQSIRKNSSLLCIGLDPDPALMPEKTEILQFNKAIINATSDIVCAYKPNIAFYEAMGDEGMDTLKKTRDYIPKDIPVIVVVLNNSMLGMVAQWQRLFYKSRYAAVKLGTVPDFAKLAQAYGAEGVKINSMNEFSNAVKKALKCEVTTVIDVPINPEDDVFPMVPPGAGLKDTVVGL